MKRFLLVTALLVVGAATAHADTSRWASNPPRGDAELHASAQVCDARVGPDRNGVPTSARYESCMKSQGWDLLEYRARQQRNVDQSSRHALRVDPQWPRLRVFELLVGMS